MSCERIFFILLVFLLSCCAIIPCRAQWVQVDGNSYRDRSDTVYNNLEAVVGASSFNIIPNSLVFAYKDNNDMTGIVGLATDSKTKQQSVIHCEDGGIFTKAIEVPKDLQLQDVPPIMVGPNYYTVRRNVSHPQVRPLLILKSTINRNVIITNTDNWYDIHAMVYSNYHNCLIVGFGDRVSCIDDSNGRAKWNYKTSFDSSRTKVQLMIDIGYLYILNDKYLVKLDEGGRMVDASLLSKRRYPSPRQELLTVNKNKVATFGYGINSQTLEVFLDKSRLDIGKKLSLELFYQDGDPIDLRDCTNALSYRNVDSIFMVCLKENSYQALKFDISNTTISLTFQMDLNTYFGHPVTVCSNQIVSYLKNGKIPLFAIACDEALVIISSDGTLTTKRDIAFSVNPQTQLFSTSYFRTNWMLIFKPTNVQVVSQYLEVEF